LQIARIGRGDDTLALLQAVENLDEASIAAAEPYIAAHRTCTIIGDDKDPVAAGILIERAVRDQQRRRRIAQRKLGLQRLTAADIARLALGECQVDLELTIIDLRVDFGDSQLIVPAADLNDCRLADINTRQIEFVDQG
jgi:hypothetical protein